MAMPELSRIDASMVALPLVSTVISVVFLIALPFRLYALYQSNVKVKATWIAPIKSGLAMAMSAVLVACLANPSQPSSNKGQPPWMIVAIISSLVAAAGLCWLLFVEHRRSIRPSAMALSYLLASLICEFIWLTAPENCELHRNYVFMTLAFSQITLKSILLILEARGKESLLYVQYQNTSPEETSGIVRGVLFWWINFFLAYGSKNNISDGDVPAIKTSLSSAKLWDEMTESWERRTFPEGKMTLPLALLRCLAGQVMRTLPFRFCVLVCQYAQPALIRYTIIFVIQNRVDSVSVAEGYWILVAACFIYIGLALSTAMFQHQLNGLRVMSRGALVGLIYTRVLNARSDQTDSGAAITLMSADVDSLSGALEMWIELLGHTLGVIIGTVMLSRQIGWLSLLPLILIFLGSRASRYVAQNLRTRQKHWSAATQARIAAVSSMLSSMKAIKALGLSDVLATHIRDLRTNEIAKANMIRWMMVIYNASANALGIFTPMLTVVFYAATGDGSLDAETAFTTVALLTMVIHPANMVMTIVPRIVTSFANFDRVQAYLLESTRQDQRVIAASTTIRLENATVKTLKTADPVLQNASLATSYSKIVSISGPVGSGKSLFASMLLGEVSLSQGVVALPTRRIGFCAQLPWLPDGTLRDIICNFEEEVDALWYEKVLNACCLIHDLTTLSDGDGTMVGTRGMNLSGGQRQRVALARLLYARCRIVILDDPFSALDRKTGESVLHNLLGPEGILRNLNTTVFWLENNASRLQFADRTFVLENGKLRDRTDVREVVETQHDHFKLEQDRDASTQATVKKLQSQRQIRKDIAADLSRRTGDFSLYRTYFRYAGVANSLLMVLCNAIYAFFVMFPQYWLKWWAESGTRNYHYYMIGYAIFAFLAWASTSLMMWTSYLLMAATSGRKFHQMLLDIVVGAPLWFFSKNDIGMTLNRFSQDIQLIDTELPSASSSLVVQFLKLMMQLGLLVAVQKLLLLTLPVCGAVVYLIQKVYLQTSRQLRFLDLESRSTVLSSFLETVDGVVTIRAFGWEQKAKARSIIGLDKSQRAAYTLMCLQRWLNLVLDLTVAGIAITLIALAVTLRDTTSGGAIGMALNVVLVANTTLLKLVQSWTNLEISLSAISRLKIMQRETFPEHQPEEGLVPPQNWPSAGRLEMRSVDAFYNPEVKALANMSLTIAPGQKVLLCGRTGSGKSTILLVLLRLVESRGLLTIDGIDMARVPRALVRKRCFITIPQDPFLLHNFSLRLNLDPEQAASDDVLVRALKSVHLWRVLTSHDMDDPATLDSELSSLPILSTGQSQLLALARALVKRESLDQRWGIKPILLLDEATSSLDVVTEDIIQNVIDEEFTKRGHTVVLITHRPQTAASRMRSGRDLVVWMKDGGIDRMGSVEDALHGV